MSSIWFLTGCCEKHRIEGEIRGKGEVGSSLRGRGQQQEENPRSLLSAGLLVFFEIYLRHEPKLRFCNGCPALMN